MKRHKLTSKHSKKLFHKTAKRVNPKNRSIRPMRGGIRA